MEAPTYMPRIGMLDQDKAKEAVRAALSALLDGGLSSVVGVSGNWEAKATRDMKTGYHIHLRCLG